MDGECIKYNTVDIGIESIEPAEVVVVPFQRHRQHDLRRFGTRTHLCWEWPFANDTSVKGVPITHCV